MDFRSLCAGRAACVLDGGLATELELRGHDLDDPLWSARLLLEDPDALRALHGDYLEAGADVVIASSYQASFEGLAARGLSHAAAERALALAVELAREARDAFVASDAARDRPRPLVAASVGPYGAARADGSEYTGAYGEALGEDALAAFHGPRYEVLAASGADVVACETIPSAVEARALVRSIERGPLPAWISFQCRDGRRLADGTPLAEIAREVAACERVVALGVNCVAPRYVESLLAELARATTKPLVVYPNSGERWDAAARAWSGERDPVAFAAAARRWTELGARAIGGCCRTGPAHVRALRAALATGR